MIPFCDLRPQHGELKKDIEGAIKAVIKRGDFILGEDVLRFEEEFASFCDCRYAVGVSSGTAAIFLALAGLDIGAGDEVLVPDFTYIATALSVSYTGAKPVFVDIDPKTYNIDVSVLEKAITKNAKAIIPVHLYGQPANMPEIMRIAKRYNLKVVEDAAQAHGAAIKMPDGKFHPAGSLGDIGCFSFYPSKNLGGFGDGGMIVTNSDDIYRKLLMLRDYGRISKYEHAIIGYNSRLDTIQAAVLSVKLKKLLTWNKMRQAAAGAYNRLFEGSSVVTPYVMDNVRHVYHVYAVRTKNREAVYNALKRKEIFSIIHYPIPVHLQKAYHGLGYKPGDFPVSESAAGEILSLPMYPHIRRDQIKTVVNTVKGAI